MVIRRSSVPVMRPLDVHRLHPGWSEQDPADWIRATQDAIAALQVAHPKELAAVRGIGLSGHMHGATLVDKHDDRRPCILWNDTRCYREAAALDADPRFRAITGNIVFPGFTAPKLVWVKNNEPETFEKTRWCFCPRTICGFGCRANICRKCRIRPARAGSTPASAHGRMSFWRPVRLTSARCRTWWKAPMAGILRPELAAAWGMRPGVVIAGGAGDNAASACGMGTVTEGSAFVSLGTSGVIFAANSSYLPNPGSAVHAFCHALPNTWHQMGVILSATDALNWYSEMTSRVCGRTDY